MNLNFNCMFILVLMLRKCLTYIRATPLAGFLPLDQNIVFHKMVGGMIAFYGITHTLAHIGNACKLKINMPVKENYPLHLSWILNHVFLSWEQLFGTEIFYIKIIL